MTAAVANPGGGPLRAAGHLHVRLADDVRNRIRGGEWEVGEQLPTEAQLCTHYGVSRSTVRAALQLLENQGLTRTRHGIGTFVTPFGPAIKTGLQELRSMSETIAAHGFTPSMRYHRVLTRPATPTEAERLQRVAGSPVLATERSVLADDELVAFSYEVTPLDLFPDGMEVSTVTGSLFALLEAHGVVATTAVAEIHAARGEGIGWGERPKGSVYLLLEQMHYDADARPLMHARTYFLEGRFQFSVLRVRQ